MRDSDAAGSLYAFDNAWQAARQRLALLEECLDEATFRRLNALGVAEGWRCLEIGAGGGSVVRWLSSKVGPAGHVIATDIETRFLDTLTETNLEVRRHDLKTDALPANKFDLIHARLVLMHIPSREKILRQLISALAAGGWLLLEEHDVYPVLATASGAYSQVWNGLIQGMVPVGVAPEWGRRLPRLLMQQGLDDVRAEGDIPIFCGASAMARFWSLSWNQVRDHILAGGVTEEVLCRTLTSLDDPQQWFTGPAIIAAWGRRRSQVAHGVVPGLSLTDQSIEE